ncbi:unnamed protein product [Boreogadus saida]
MDACLFGGILRVIFVVYKNNIYPFPPPPPDTHPFCLHTLGWHSVYFRQGKARQLYLYSTFHTQGRLKVLHISTHVPLLISPPSAKLRTNKEVCIDPNMPWLKQYLKNAFKR